MKEQTFQQRLINVQSRLKAPKGQYNSFGKYSYRNQEDVLEALKPLLAENELVLTLSDSIHEIFGLVYVESKVRVSSGAEEITVTAQAGIDPNRKGMDIAQSFGSSSSYARKYALNAMFLIDDTKDADSTNTHGKGAQVQVTTAKPSVSAKPSAGSELFQKAVDRMKEVGTKEKYEEILTAIGDQLSDDQRTALSKFINK
jgi:hypothetical protein